MPVACSRQRRKAAKGGLLSLNYLASVILTLEKLSLPFKGRVGVRMGVSGAEDPHPPPVLPLEGGGT